jgi:CRP/FNR family transcriptional regulator, anaerobic regulatory protein
MEERKAEIRKKLAALGPDLVNDILEHAVIKAIPAGKEILKEGEFIRYIPIVHEGLIKVFTRTHDKELLLYYIQPAESCIMSFSSALRNEPGRVAAITEQASVLVLLPIERLGFWLQQFPSFNLLFYEQFNLRYTELIHTINQLLYDKLDKRLMEYLQEKRDLSGKKIISLSHREIAQELGTAREVISRLVKKLEKENRVRQLNEGIEILQ